MVCLHSHQVLLSESLLPQEYWQFLLSSWVSLDGAGQLQISARSSWESWNKEESPWRAELNENCGEDDDVDGDDDDDNDRC
mmetsp:Transcript_9519/g.17476  ORF Transcript_9519/g.17476 Transcript_9519/m.17476 type:complete len:81 (+) Transcript_9519:56-298(+)